MLQRFQRITSGSSWIPQIDGLRFIAIISVLLIHAYGEVTTRGPRLFPALYQGHWYTTAVNNGQRGVLLFFAISGYILARPFLRQHLLQGHPVGLRQYFMRRLTRLEPPYILSLFIYAIAQYLGRHVSLHWELTQVGASMAYLHNQIYPYTGAINFVTWTLEIEVQFYILAPLLACVFIIRRTALRRAAIVLLIIAATFLMQASSHNIHSILSILYFLQYFLLGFLLADLLEYPRHAPTRNWSWDLVSLIAWPIIFVLPPEFPCVTAILLVLLFLVCLAAFHGKASSWFFRQPFVALTGGMCYSIYLMHFLVIETAFRVVKNLQFHQAVPTILLQITLLVIPAVSVSAIFFLYIERPCMDPQWPQKLWHKLRPPTTAPLTD